MTDEGEESRHVGVVAVEFPVAPHYRVDAACLLRDVRNPVEVPYDRLLIGDRHIQPVEPAVSEQVFYPVLLALAEQIFVIGEERVDLG